MTRKEIQKEIIRLQIMLREEEEKEREEHREQARKFVGKCYIGPDGKMLKIISIPITKLYMTGQSYNEYQFPALFLNYPTALKEKYIDDQLDEFSPFKIDTVYFNIKNNVPGEYNGSYDEITNEEFNIELDKCINHFKELIGT